MREWDADTYHRVSDPQYHWGLAVLDRLPVAGDELALDVGCGTGRLTAALAARLPRGRILAIDHSSNMVTVASRQLAGAHPRLQVIQADASRLPVHARADLIFSTATFHWVLDHRRLFRNLHDALAPGGRLFAQCGGGPNITRLRDRAGAVMREPAFAPFFRDWREPWEFADAATTAARMREAGFTDIRTSLEAAPVVLPDAEAFATFVAHVNCRQHLAHLPDATRRAAFIERLTVLATRDEPAFLLDYCRLNIAGVRPA